MVLGLGFPVRISTQVFVWPIAKLLASVPGIVVKAKGQRLRIQTHSGSIRDGF